MNKSLSFFENSSFQLFHLERVCGTTNNDEDVIASGTIKEITLKFNGLENLNLI
jgi:hypothetical protein